MTATDDATGEVRTDVGLAGVDENELLKQWAIFVTGFLLVFAIATFLHDFLYSELLEVDMSEMTGSSFNAVYDVIVLGVVFGAIAGYKSGHPDGVLYKCLGVAVAVGTIGWAIVDIGLATAIVADSGSLDIVELVKFAVTWAIGAAIAVVGAAWLLRNQAPDELAR